MSNLLKEKKRRDMIDRFAVLKNRRAEAKKALEDVDAEIDAFTKEATDAGVFKAAEMEEVTGMKA